MISNSSSDGDLSPVSSSSGFLSTNSNPIEDQRALKLAFELSMASLTDVSKHFSQGNISLTNFEEKFKKSQNMTECVPVPSSEHVAEIVGRQGCKIKALRAKTNTYIKTPVRGEEPVFVVTGRKEDVSKAKREIISAAEHFSLIRASRKPISANQLIEPINIHTPSNGFLSKSISTSHNPPLIPGQITIQVRVPYRVVGLVVGPKGATIKNIQHETQTYIVTPSRDKEPIFEVTGLTENVQSARKQIESHIALRTGNYQTSNPDINHVISTCNSSTFQQIINENDILNSLYKTSIFQPMADIGIVEKSNNFVNIWKNIMESTEGELNLLSPLCSNEITIIDSSSGCSSSASTGSSSSLSSTNILKDKNHRTNSDKQKECFLCGNRNLPSPEIVFLSNNIFCKECTNKMKLTEGLSFDGESMDFGSKYRFMIT